MDLRPDVRSPHSAHGGDTLRGLFGMAFRRRPRMNGAGFDANDDRFDIFGDEDALYTWPLNAVAPPSAA